MQIPIQRRMSKPNAGTAGVAELMVDQVTQLTFIQLSTPNQVLDIYNSPDPSGGINTNIYEYELLKNSISTGRTFYSESMSTSSAGRAAVGPISISPGQLQMTSKQTLGTAAAQSDIVIKFANSFG
jgi:hypothetical protein